MTAGGETKVTDTGDSDGLSIDAKTFISVWCGGQNLSIHIALTKLEEQSAYNIARNRQ